jgi:hypothetical protein
MEQLATLLKTKKRLTLDQCYFVPHLVKAPVHFRPFAIKFRTPGGLPSELLRLYK